MSIIKKLLSWFNSEDSDGSEIEEGNFGSTLAELELEDGDVLNIKDKLSQDWYVRFQLFTSIILRMRKIFINLENYHHIYSQSYSAKMGKMVVLNGTDNEWTIKLYPNIVGKVSKEEKRIEVSSEILLNIRNI